MNTSLSWGKHLAALLCGGLLPLGLSPFDHWPLAILSCGLLALLLEGYGPKVVFRLCLCYGIGLFGVGVSWVYVSIHVHGGESVAISLFLTSLFVLALALVFAIPFSLYGCFRNTGRLARLAVFPCLWVLVEWLRGWIFTGFAWLYLGNSFTGTWLAGWAPIGGVLLLSLIGAFSAVALLQLVAPSHSPATARHSRALRFIPVLVAGTLWLNGQSLGQISWTAPAPKSLSLAMVQPALTPSQKWNSEILYDILVQLRDQSTGLWGKDLLIWPESAIPAPARDRDVEPFMTFLEGMAKASGTTLITGIPLYEAGRYYNGVILVGDDQGTYAKRHLVPFGEYLPLDSLLRGIINFFDRPMSSFTAGAENQPLLNAKGTALAAAICYEIIFQDLVSSTAADAEVILTLSNDVWFGDTIAPHQHLQMARLRAIENGKPVVRATNDGISAVIDPRGRITARMPQFTAATLETEVLPYRGQTPFNRFNSWPVVIFCLLALGAVATLGRTPQVPVFIGR